MEQRPRPRIVITVGETAGRPDPALAEEKNRLYRDLIARHGGEPVLVDAASLPGERQAAFDSMSGLLLSGGADIDPARYGRPAAGAVGIEPERDELEAEAWAAAERRSLPVLGICRGHQAVNVFSGGTLLQDVDGHDSPGWHSGPARLHPMRLVPGTRLARILFPTNPRGGVLRVNTYHHQSVRGEDLAPGLIASAWASGPAGDVVEGLEGSGDRLVLGVQCHPERAESTPPEFERLWAFFVDACRGPVSRRGPNVRR